MSTPTFDSPNLLNLLEAASPETLDGLPFGVVRMDREATVVNYNRFESERSGLSPESVLGRNFFIEVAVCTNNFMVAQKFEDIAELDETLDYVFTFRMKPTKVQLRLLRSAAVPHQYVVIRRDV